MQKQVIGEIDVPMLPLLRHRIPRDQIKPCQFNSWCFGQASLWTRVELLVEVGDVAIIVRSPAWVCQKCEEFELPDWAKLVMQMSIFDFVEKHNPWQFSLSPELVPIHKGFTILVT